MTRALSKLPAIAGLGLVSLVYFAPILVAPASRVAGGAGDPMLVAYIVTWVAHHLWTSAAWNPPFLHPAENVLAYSDHLYGLAVMSWPAVVAGVPPTLIVNLIAWAAFLLTSIAVMAWLLDSRRDAWTACAAAIVVSYCAWRTQQLSHPHLIFLPFLPIALLSFDRAIERRGPLWLVWIAAALLAVQTLSVTSIAVFALPLVAVYLAVRLGLERRELRCWLACGAAVAAAGIANLPVAMRYWALGGGFERSPVEVARHSASWVDWISAPYNHWLYGDRLAFTLGLERELFPGIGFALVVLVGLISLARSRPLNRGVWAATIVAALALWAATGPSRGSSFSLLHLPYDIFAAAVPGARNVRVPARLVVLAAMFLAPLIAEGFRQVFTRGRAAGFVVLVVALAEGLPGLARYEVAAVPPIEALPAQTAARGLLFLPLGDPGVEIRRMWQARDRGVPVVNGFSGHPSYLWEAIRHLQGAPIDDDVRRAFYSRLETSGVDTIVVEASGSPLVHEPLLERISDRAYRIPPSAPLSLKAIALGRGAGLLVPELGWSYPEQDGKESWMWTLDQRAGFSLPLDGSPVRRIALRVRALRDGGQVSLRWKEGSLGAQTIGTKTTVITFNLPDGATRAGWTRFELEGPRAERPKGSEDPRRLGVCVYEISLLSEGS